MQNRAFSTCQRVLTLGLGFGGMLNVLCASALAQAKTDLPVDTEESNQVIHRATAPLKAVLPKSVLSKPVLTKSVLTKPTQVSIPQVNFSAEALSSVSLAATARMGSVEDSASPQFSPPVCHQAACLTGSVPRVIASPTDEVRSAAQLALEPAPQTEETASKQPLEASGEEHLEEEHLEEDHLDKTVATSAVDSTELSQVETEFLENISKNVNPVEKPLEAASVGAVIAQATPADVPNFLPDVVGDDIAEPGSVLDDELGTLRLQQTRSRSEEELGILRLMQTAQAPPPPPKQPIAFLGGRLGFFNTDNAFRSEIEIEEQIYQSGLTLYLFPKVSEKTSLYAIAEAGIARYEVDYNELEVQAGVRHRLFKRTFAQVGWRNQRLYTPGYREKLLGVNYLDALVSHRRVFSKRAWADGFYQIRLGFADPVEASRFRQTIIASINYAATPNFRTSLLYQLEFDDYLQIDRYDISQQFLGAISYNITPESKISLFGGTRFGNSSAAGVDLNDVFYGAGLNVNVPLF
ncbi:MAG: hypothetical protein AAF716_17580 [Cyanobacteria bacterium P01_D01_bin.1]